MGKRDLSLTPRNEETRERSGKPFLPYSAFAKQSVMFLAEK